MEEVSNNSGIHEVIIRLTFNKGAPNKRFLTEEKGVLGPGKPSCGHASGRLLDGHPLVVLVQGLLHVDLEGSLALALWAGARLDLLVLGLDERAEDIVALVAVVLDHAQLGQHAGGGGDNPRGADQLVEVQLAQGADLLDQGQVGDADVDFLKQKIANEMGNWTKMKLKLVHLPAG